MAKGDKNPKKIRRESAVGKATARERNRRLKCDE
jgi:hypothetical protein